MLLVDAIASRAEGARWGAGGGAETMAAQRSPPEAAIRRCVADGCMVNKTANNNDAAASPIRPCDEDDRKRVREPPPAGGHNAAAGHLGRPDQTRSPDEDDRKCVREPPRWRP